jgi:uncharacterized protein (UPF0262 family)
MSGDCHIASVLLDERARVRRNREIEHECAVAIHDLIEANSFRPLNSEAGPYQLVLRLEASRIVLEIAGENGEAAQCISLWLTPLQRVIKDYFTVCESYFKAIPDQPHARIEALDMARRSLHDEGAQLLHEALKDKIEMDDDTARRLFTLICVLQMRG